MQGEKPAGASAEFKGASPQQRDHRQLFQLAIPLVIAGYKNMQDPLLPLSFHKIENCKTKGAILGEHPGCLSAIVICECLWNFVK